MFGRRFAASARRTSRAATLLAPTTVAPRHAQQCRFFELAPGAIASFIEADLTGLATLPNPQPVLTRQPD